MKFIGLILLLWNTVATAQEADVNVAPPDIVEKGVFLQTHWAIEFPMSDRGNTEIPGYLSGPAIDFRVAIPFRISDYLEVGPVVGYRILYSSTSADTNGEQSWFYRDWSTSGLQAGVHLQAMSGGFFKQGIYVAGLIGITTEAESTTTAYFGTAEDAKQMGRRNTTSATMGHIEAGYQMWTHVFSPTLALGIMLGVDHTWFSHSGDDGRQAHWLAGSGFRW